MISRETRFWRKRFLIQCIDQLCLKKSDFYKNLIAWLKSITVKYTQQKLFFTNISEGKYKTDLYNEILL
jgi:hypothetical protein